MRMLNTMNMSKTGRLAQPTLWESIASKRSDSRKASGHHDIRRGLLCCPTTAAHAEESCAGTGGCRIMLAATTGRLSRCDVNKLPRHRCKRCWG